MKLLFDTGAYPFVLPPTQFNTIKNQLGGYREENRWYFNCTFGGNYPIWSLQVKPGVFFKLDYTADSNPFLVPGKCYLYFLPQPHNTWLFGNTLMWKLLIIYDLQKTPYQIGIAYAPAKMRPAPPMPTLVSPDMYT
eukprot:Sdes_comp25651_c0_seq1m22825